MIKNKLRNNFINLNATHSFDIHAKTVQFIRTDGKN